MKTIKQYEREQDDFNKLALQLMVDCNEPVEKISIKLKDISETIIFENAQILFMDNLFKDTELFIFGGGKTTFHCNYEDISVIELVIKS